MANATEYYVSKANLTSVITKVETKLQNRYTKAQADSAIANAIAGVTQFDYEIPEGGVLPQEGKKGVVYLIPNSGTGSNLYNEYIWIVVEGTGHFELFGSREIDISGKLENADVKVTSSSLTKTNDESGNGFTLDLAAGVKTSLGLADSALQPGDVEPLSTSDVNDILAILTDDTVTP